MQKLLLNIDRDDRPKGGTAVQTVYDGSGIVHENLQPHTLDEPPLGST